MANDTNTNTFILSDESLNSYGFVVQTAGIDTAQFERNPVMLYMHDRESGVVGRWENIRKDGNRLLADAVFDESTELGAKIKTQVANGFLRCVSIGIDNVTQEDLNNVQTVTKCRLIEASIVDIPSNANAVKLFRRSGSFTYRLSDLNGNDPDEFRTAVIAVLGLKPSASNAEILRAIEKAVNGTESAEELLNNAVARGYIDPAQRENFRAMAKGNRRALMAYIDTQRNTEAKEIESMLRTAAGTSRILAYEIDLYRRIGKATGARTLRELLDTLPGATKPLDIIKRGKDREGWGLREYRKFAPKELQDNPDLYARLVKEESGRSVEPHSLEWYRRNNPEYLKEHPEIYRELLEKEREQRKRNK
nr:MAG TPA: prohead serine protease [Caudoviricetes sp.]